MTSDGVRKGWARVFEAWGPEAVQRLKKHRARRTPVQFSPFLFVAAGIG